jgi:hypothetical protein
MSGVGKTHARRNHPELKDLPQVDIADVYRDLNTTNYIAAHTGLIERVRKLMEKHDTVVVEGYYLPETPTRRMLERGFDDFDVEFRLMYAPLGVCKERVEASGVDVGIRTEILEHVWENYGGMMRRKHAAGETWEPDYG